MACEMQAVIREHFRSTRSKGKAGTNSSVALPVPPNNCQLSGWQLGCPRSFRPRQIWRCPGSGRRLSGKKPASHAMSMTNVPVSGVTLSAVDR